MSDPVIGNGQCPEVPMVMRRGLDMVVVLPLRDGDDPVAGHTFDGRIVDPSDPTWPGVALALDSATAGELEVMLTEAQVETVNTRMDGLVGEALRYYVNDETTQRPLLVGPVHVLDASHPGLPVDLAAGWRLDVGETVVVLESPAGLVAVPTTATVPATGAAIIAAIAGDDGAGSGLDADTVDGKHSSEFAPVVHSHPYEPAGGLSAHAAARNPHQTRVGDLAQVTVPGGQPQPGRLFALGANGSGGWVLTEITGSGADIDEAAVEAIADGRPINAHAAATGPVDAGVAAHPTAANHLATALHAWGWRGASAVTVGRAITVSDLGMVLTVDSTAGPVTLSVPTDTAQPLIGVGFRCLVVLDAGANPVTIDAQAGATVRPSGFLSTSTLGAMLLVTKVAANRWSVGPLAGTGAAGAATMLVEWDGVGATPAAAPASGDYLAVLTGTPKVFTHLSPNGSTGWVALADCPDGDPCRRCASPPVAFDRRAGLVTLSDAFLGGLGDATPGLAAVYSIRESSAPNSGRVHSLELPSESGWTEINDGTGTGDGTNSGAQNLAVLPDGRLAAVRYGVLWTWDPGDAPEEAVQTPITGTNKPGNVASWGVWDPVDQVLLVGQPASGSCQLYELDVLGMTPGPGGSVASVLGLNVTGLDATHAGGDLDIRPDNGELVAMTRTTATTPRVVKFYTINRSTGAATTLNTGDTTMPVSPNSTPNAMYIHATAPLQLRIANAETNAQVTRWVQGVGWSDTGQTVPGGQPAAMSARWVGAAGADDVATLEHVVEWVNDCDDPGCSAYTEAVDVWLEVAMMLEGEIGQGHQYLVEVYAGVDGAGELVAAVPFDNSPGTGVRSLSAAVNAAVPIGTVAAGGSVDVGITRVSVSAIARDEAHDSTIVARPSTVKIHAAPVGA